MDENIEHLDFAPKLICQMFHVENEGDMNEVAKKCQRPAAYIGHLHSCKDRYRKQGEQTKGEIGLFCQYYFEKCRDAGYEMRCRGCQAYFTSILDRMWDFAPIRSSEGSPNEETS